MLDPVVHLLLGTLPPLRWSSSKHPAIVNRIFNYSCDRPSCTLTVCQFYPFTLFCVTVSRDLLHLSVHRNSRTTQLDPNRYHERRRFKFVHP